MNLLKIKIKAKEIIHLVTGRETVIEKSKRKFLKLYGHTIDPEICEMVDYIKETGQFNMINRHLRNDWSNIAPVVEMDQSKGMHFVMDANRPIYWPRKYNKDEVANQYKGIKIEQDEYSPHRYLTDDDIEYMCRFRTNGGRIISFECGAMEGMFTRQLIDLVDEAYMFECEADWREALDATFSEYVGKTYVINKYVSNTTAGNTIAIDDVFADLGGGVNLDDTLIVLKMDIEGFEMLALEGARKMLSKATHVLAFVCAYHKQNDENEIRHFFENGYDIGHTDGYFCFYADPTYDAPYIRRCVMKIKKKT